MPDSEARRYSAGDEVDDWCRPCKFEREHRVITASSEGVVLRVICDWCGSQHNFRGGGPPRSRAEPGRSAPQKSSAPMELVSEKEREFPVFMTQDHDGSAQDLELMLRRIIREESGLTAVVPADKWRGGTLVLKSGREGVQDKEIPIDTFFNKIVMLRNRLRVLEQNLNTSELSPELKIKLQSYITACYGSLTTFNVLFAEEDDRFKGAGK